MGFPQYSNLPMELRLHVIDEFLKIPGGLGYHTRLSQFSCVNSEWNNVIERILFKKLKITELEAEEFGRICGPRQRLLDRISFEPILHYANGLDNRVQNQEIIKRNVSALFDALKDWSCADRPRGLITLCICINIARNPWVNGGRVESISCDFTGLPEVPVIGRLVTDQLSFDAFYLDHYTVNALYQRLPNLCGVSIPLPSELPVQLTIDQARSNMVEIHGTKPSLRTLTITRNPRTTDNWFFSDSEIRDRDDEITIAISLTPTVALWCQTLVCLKIDSIIDIPQFLLTASDSMWPNLQTMDAAGILDEDEGADTPGSGGLDPEKEYRVAGELLQGLTAALPGMPSLITFQVRFRDPTNGRWACCLSMDLSPEVNTRRLVWQPTPSAMEMYQEAHFLPVVPCSNPMTGGGTLLIRHVVPPGQLLTDFQNTVWQHRYRKVAVCCCRDDELRPRTKVFPLLPCTQWNKETGCWDLALMNDMNVFIWHMGKFFEKMHDWDYWKEHDPEIFKGLLDADFKEDFGP